MCLVPLLICLAATLWARTSATPCGVTFSNSSGVITSPDWPGEYPMHLEDCSWTIQKDSTREMSLLFTRFNLQKERQETVYRNYRSQYRSTRPADTVEVHFGTTVLPSLEIRGPFTGDSVPALISIPAHLSIGVITVALKTHDRQGPGFQLTYFEHTPQWNSWDLNSSRANSVLSCANGAYNSSLHGACVCPAGFYGPTCAEACSVIYGPSCDTCFNEPMGCLGKLFCNTYGSLRMLIPDLVISETDLQQMTTRIDPHSECSCASGLSGSNCDQVCGPGAYGANCNQKCGHCRKENDCDPYSGHCHGGCIAGFSPPYCHKALLHLLEGFSPTSVNDASFSGSFQISPNNTDGDGVMTFFEVQYKTKDEEAVWTTGAFGRLITDDVNHFTVARLRPNTTYSARVVLLNEDLVGYRNAAQTTVKTTGKRRITNMKVWNVSSRGMHVSWTSPSDEKDFSVIYECQTILACSDNCSSACGMKIVSKQTSALLDGLQPASIYLIKVGVDDEWESKTVTTHMEVPEAKVSAIQVSLVTNTSALLQWWPALLCAEVNGPAIGYRWQLRRLTDSSNTTNMTAGPSGESTNMRVLLRNLEPLSSYEFSVTIVNAIGVNPDRWSALNFTTLPSVPDAPRDLDVYRVNHTALWLRWRAPARPSGELNFYIVEVDGGGLPSGQRREKLHVSHPTKETKQAQNEYAVACAAWPDFVCHSVHGLLPDTNYTLTVSATNVYGDAPGETASIMASTTPSGEPTPPRNLRAKDVKAHSAVLEWQLPDRLNSDLSHFEVVATPRRGRAGRLTSSRPVKLEVNAAEELAWYSCTVEGLQPDATYSVAVRCGWNGEAATIQVDTDTASP